MGINNLLKTLRSISIKKHLKEYQNKRVAIDGYCWLHKSIFSIGTSILDEKIDITPCIYYFKRKLFKLLQYNIIPIVVFDGSKIPIKKNEEERRKKNRKELLKESEKYLKMNDKYQASKIKIQAFDISPQFAYEFIKILKEYNIEYIVAPYEADIQLAYLSKINYVDFIITEDSDLIALGCKCVLYKLDQDDNDSGYEICYDNLKKCDCFDFSFFNEDKFLSFCILCGCDYFKINGVGSKLAYYAVKDYNNYIQSINFLIKKLKNVNLNAKILIEMFEKAFLAFKYQIIYCPIEKKMKYYRDINENIYPFINKYLENDLDFVGKIETDSKKVYEHVKGIIDPISHVLLDKNQDLFINKYGKNKEKNEKEVNCNENIIKCNLKGNNNKKKKKNIIQRARNQFSLDNFLIKKIKNESNQKLNDNISLIKKNINNNKENLINNETIKTNIITINSSYCFDKSFSKISNISNHIINNETQEETQLNEEQNSIDNKLNYIQTQRDFIVKKRKYNIIQNQKYQSKTLLNENSTFNTFLNGYSYKKEDFNKTNEDESNNDDFSLSEIDINNFDSEEKQVSKNKNSYLLDINYTPIFKNRIFSQKDTSSSNKISLSFSSPKKNFGLISIEQYKFDPSNFN